MISGLFWPTDGCPCQTTSFILRFSNTYASFFFLKVHELLNGEADRIIDLAEVGRIIAKQTFEAARNILDPAGVAAQKADMAAQNELG